MFMALLQKNKEIVKLNILFILLYYVELKRNEVSTLVALGGLRENLYTEKICKSDIKYFEVKSKEIDRL